MRSDPVYSAVGLNRRSPDRLFPSDRDRPTDRPIDRKRIENE